MNSFNTYVHALLGDELTLDLSAHARDCPLTGLVLVPCPGTLLTLDMLQTDAGEGEGEREGNIRRLFTVKLLLELQNPVI